MKITCGRDHEISCGHRVVGHEGHCRNLHGHNYGFRFQCEVAELDNVGRVIDFGVIKSTLCAWLEEHWDHRMLLWREDPLVETLAAIDPTAVAVPFNPTAENIAKHMLKVVGPELLAGHVGVRLSKVTVQETGKCSASCELDDEDRTVLT